MQGKDIIKYTAGIKKRIIYGTSFICTVYNEEDSIIEFLDSLKRQTMLPSEIIIVDGGSRDGTFKLMQGFFEKWEAEKDSIIKFSAAAAVDGGRLEVRLIRKEGAGISSGRNTAIAMASGTFISASDAGCILDCKWFEEINKGMDIDDKIVNGGISYALCGNLLQKILALCIMPGLNEVKTESFMPSSRNICFRKTSWEEAGGYPEELDFGEDMKFDFILREKGHGLIFKPRAVVLWKMRKGLSGIFRQFFRYAKGDALGRMYHLRHIIRFTSGAAFAAIIIAGIMVDPWILASLAILGPAYCSRPWYRLLFRWVGNEACRPLRAGKLAAILSVPLMLFYIDSAKASGYLYGLSRR